MVPAVVVLVVVVVVMPLWKVGLVHAAAVAALWTQRIMRTDLHTNQIVLFFMQTTIVTNFANGRLMDGGLLFFLWILGTYGQPPENRLTVI